MPARRLRLVRINAPDPDDQSGQALVRVGEELPTNAGLIDLLIRPYPVSDPSPHPFAGTDMVDLDVDSPAILAMDPAIRRETLFTAMLEHLHTVARARGWNPSRIDAVADRCRAEGLRFTWTSRPLWNRSRDHQAQARFWFDDDGSCHGGVQILDRDAVLVATSPPAPGYPFLPGFPRAAKTLRWLNHHQATFIPHGDRFGARPTAVTASIT